MSDTLLTAGQFARLARTTKRTILWYDEKGVLIVGAAGGSRIVS